MTYTPTREDKASSILLNAWDETLQPLRDQITVAYLALGNDNFENDNYAKAVGRMIFDLSLLADRLAKEIDAARDALGKRDEIDWNAVRQRIKVAVKALDIDSRDAREILDKSDEELNASGPLVAFAKHHGLSLDWLIADDVTALLRTAAKDWREGDTQH